jgi:predicted RNase H-like nuclease
VVAGVDGCHGGWICVLRNVEQPYHERAFLAKSINEVLSHIEDPAVIAIDIPIGLPSRAAKGGRDCDIAVRVNLGKRSLSVFAVPARAAVAETDYRRACAVALLNSDPPRQISRQMFHLFPKIREVDIVMTPQLQNRVYECHPEAVFWAMNGKQSLGEPKKLGGRIHVPGLEMRRKLLIENGFSEPFLRETRFRRADATPDDFLDACACAWTAARIYNGEAIRFPARAPLDAKGLRMEILV